MRAIMGLLLIGFLIAGTLPANATSRHAISAGQSPGAILDRIKSDLPELLAGGRPILDSLEKRDIFQPAKRHDLYRDLKELPVPATRALQNWVTATETQPERFGVPLQFEWNSRAKIGAIIQPTGMHCEVWNLIADANGHAHTVKPLLANENPTCWTDGEQIALGVIGDRPALIDDAFGSSLTAGAFTDQFSLTLWNGTAWLPWQTLVVTYNYAPERAARIKGFCLHGLCRPAKSLAYRIIKSFGPSRHMKVPETSLTAAQLRAVTVAKNGHSAGCDDEPIPDDLAELTGNQSDGVFGITYGPPGTSTWNEDGFEGDAIMFGTRLNGAFVLACVGHISYPPEQREGEAWLVRFSRFHNGSWLPVAFLQVNPSQSSVHIIVAKVL